MQRPILHPFVWCVLGIPLFCVWVLVFQYLQTSLAEASNRTNVNVSQYSVLLSNVGDVECDQKRLQEFGRYCTLQFPSTCVLLLTCSFVAEQLLCWLLQLPTGSISFQCSASSMQMVMW